MPPARRASRRCPLSCARPTTATRCCSGSSRTSRARICRRSRRRARYAVLLDEFGLSLGEVAERVGKSKPTVSNRVRLLELPDDVLDDGRARRAVRGPRARGARRSRPRRPAPARPPDRRARASRCGPPSARRDGRAHGRRSAATSAVDPAVAAPRQGGVPAADRVRGEGRRAPGCTGRSRRRRRSSRSSPRRSSGCSPADTLRNRRSGRRVAPV